MSDWDRETRPRLLYVFQGTVVNGAGGAGAQTYTVVPGEGHFLEIIDGMILNGDSAGRTVTATIDTGTSNENIGGPIADAETLGGGTRMGLFSGVADVNNPRPSGRLIVAGPERLVITIAAVAASQDSAFGFHAWLHGNEPTITLAGASTPTTTTNEARVFA